ncbi:MAG: M20/M25/M40 family metallo-hydrolase [Clostridiales bacterium]|nr:M20/M25/M40 family metallo-hydrolase [Clostridiales bacterium]
MWWIAPAVVGLLLLAFIGVVIGRAIAFKPKAVSVPVPVKVAFDRKRVEQNLSELIKFKTVSHYEKELEDNAEFERFIERVKTMYPLVHEKCELTRHGDRGLLYKLKGQSRGPCTVLMAHYDVVPAQEEAWQKPPFSGAIEDGYIWGRGTLDTKCTFCGILEALEALLSGGYIPKRDLYLSFAGDEEVTGNSTPSIVEYFKKNNIEIGLVVDEGGAVVENAIPGLKKPCALIGTAEKGIMDLHFKMKSDGGHASTPPAHTIVGKLAKAIVKVEGKTPKARMTPDTKEMFDTLGRHLNFGLKIIFANLWCFKPLLALLGKFIGGEINALLRTTYAFTAMKGSDAANVLPPEAEVIANIRIIPGETCESVVERVRKIINNDSIELYMTEELDPSPSSVTDCEGYEALAETIRECWQGTVVSPYLMIASSDAKHYSLISDKVYRFSPMSLSKDERSMIHGHNERIAVEKMHRIVKFYMRLMLKR